MSFKKGNTHGKGRPKGSQNKETKELRERVNDLLNMNWESIQKDLIELKPKDRVNAYIRLLEYALPKLNRTEVKNITSIDDFIKMTSAERRERIIEINKILNSKNNG